MAEAKTYDCPDPDCDEVFTNHKSVGPHMKAHKPEEPCDICGLMVKNLSFHKSRIHPGGDASPDVKMRRAELEIKRLREALVRKDLELRNTRGELLRLRARMGGRRA